MQDVQLNYMRVLRVSKMSTLIVNNFYKLEPILIILVHLYVETTGF